LYSDLAALVGSLLVTKAATAAISLWGLRVKAAPVRTRRTVRWDGFKRARICSMT